VTSVTDAESLFAQYYDRLLRYLTRVAGQGEAARDLTQEVFLRVSRTAIPAAPENQQAGWLFKIARNVALDHRRQQRRRPETDLGSASEGTTDAQQEMVLALKQALATLPDLDTSIETSFFSAKSAV
jgi:RNA polymerase sigma factor (sigma-70 family)